MPIYNELCSVFESYVDSLLFTAQKLKKSQIGLLLVSIFRIAMNYKGVINSSLDSA